METTEEKLNRIKNMALKGLKSQLMRGDRTSNQCWFISLRFVDKIVEECETNNR